MVKEHSLGYNVPQFHTFRLKGRQFYPRLCSTYHMLPGRHKTMYPE